jgi:SAM-dependent methyltransferase
MNDEVSCLRQIRGVLRLRQRARAFRNKLLRRAGFLGEEWSDALPKELQGWENALREEGRYWLHSEYKKRMDPQCELQDNLKQLVQAPPGAIIRILDVGAGPLTCVGKKWEGRILELLPVDPLAEEYKKVLARLRIRPPIFTKPGHGEKLLDQFNKNHFDLVCAFNSLDHSYDPLLAIRQMFAVVKPQCYVYLYHLAKEGLNEGYKGLHQWDFYLKQGDTILSNGRGIRHSLAAEFEGIGALECEYVFEKFGETKVKVVVSKLKKLRES